MNTSSPTILVTGATGNIGRALVPLLRDAGARVIAGHRSDAPVDGVPGRALDYADPASLARAFAGIDHLFLLLPLVPAKLELARNALAAARAAGVRHIVRSSGMGADPSSPFALNRLQGEIDRLVVDSPIPTTVVRPNSFMQNWIHFHGAMVRSGQVFLAHGDGRSSWIDVADIAAAAAAILRDPAPHAGQAYTLTGPQALSDAEVLATIEGAGGPRASYVAVPDSAAVDAMLKMGMDPWTVEILASLNRFIAGGHAAELTGAVQALTGRAPRSFAQFAQQNLAGWR